MSRKRLSWMKKADPYTMNQDREQPPHEKYLIGGPSEFAEDVHRPGPDDPALGRNEIGQPNMSKWNLTHKDVDEWNSDEPYDNTKSAMSREAARDVYAHLERKAFQCVKIADALLPGAPESLIEEQAFDFMSLPDEVVTATLVRLTAAEDEDGEDESEEEADEDTEASFDEDRIEAMLREMLAEEDEDDDEDEDEDEEEEEDDEVEAMVREMMAEDSDSEEDDMEIELEPTMEASVGIGEDDTVLASLFSDTVPKEARPSTHEPQARQASGSRQGVQSLGGRVKAAADGGDDVDLSKLWQSDPDVSDVF